MKKDWRLELQELQKTTVNKNVRGKRILIVYRGWVEGLCFAFSALQAFTPAQ